MDPKSPDSEKGLMLNEEIASFSSFLEGQNAQDLEIINIQGHESITDCIIVAGATSRRHAQGLAEGIGRICREKGYDFLGMEGFDLADWILVDCNDVIVNIFQEETRKLYKLEELWSRDLLTRQQDKKS